MGDPDAYQLGGALGAMSRAAQLAALQAQSSANRAASLLRQSRPERARPAPDTRQLIDAINNRPGGPMLGPPMPPPKPPAPPPPLAPSPPVSLGMVRLREGEPLHNKPTPPTSQVGSKGIQMQMEGGPKLLTGSSQKLRNTITSMIEDIKNDPIPNLAKQNAAKAVAESFREGTRNRLFTEDELYDNPVIRTLNETATWSQLRRKITNFNARKHKVEGDPETAGGDGTFSDMIDEDDRTLSQALNSGNLPPYLVTRDKKGFLHVITADQWVRGKFLEMKQDPKFAADVITSLAMTSLYGSDSAAEAQKNRVSVDRNGNPVKALAGPEDEKALAALAKEVAGWQNGGDETAVDDVFANLAMLGRQITDQNKANGEFDSGSGGRRGGGGGGFGGGGGGQSVRLSDPTALGAMVDSISRQRMGRSLTPEEQQAFIAYFHQLEQQSSAGYYSGGTYTPPDAEGQAVDWVVKHFGREADSNQYANLAAQFVSLMGSSNPFGAIAS